MASTFNAFGKTRKEWGNPSVPVWLGKVRAVPVGGSLADADIIDGAFYAAGTPVQLDGKTIKIFRGYKVKSFAAGESTADDTIVAYAEGNIAPEVGDIIQVVGATFAATGKAAAVKSVAVADGEITITVANAALGTPAAGDVITYSASESAGTGKAIAVIPNGYLYNDIYLDNIDVNDECAGASGAVVRYHGEGILINRTPAAIVKEQMAAAVPGVLQVNY